MRRTWMLLLVTVLLAVFLAVPAMAADDCCDGGHCATCAGETPHDEWTGELSADTEFVDGGKYYVPEGGLEADLTVTGDITVTICLNNATLTGRMTVSSGATVNIVDCSAVTDGVSAGKIQGITTTDNGGALYVSGSVVNIYDGTILGGTAASGGSISAVSSSTVTLYRGVIDGGTSTGQGGNVHVSASVFNVGKPGVEESDTLNAVTKIVNGSTSGTNIHAGNVYVEGGATMNMYYGTISDGTATGQGGNVRSNGTFNMHGGVIKDGYSTKSTANHNMWVQSDSGKLIMDGGHIYGYVSFYGTGAEALQLSGKAKIYAPDSDGDGLPDGGVSALVDPIFLDKLDNEAKIAISVSADTTTITYNAEKSYEGIKDDWIGYINHQIVGYGTFWWTWQEVDGAGTIVRQAEATNTIWHCLCGANAGEDHIGECVGYDIPWTKWLIASNATLPNTASDDALYYYLVDNDGTADNTITWTSAKTLGKIDSTTTSTTDTNTRKIFVDFNGITIKTTSGIRMLTIGSDYGAQQFTFTDSSQGHTGGFDSDSTGSDQGLMIWMRAYTASGATDGYHDHILKVYRLNMDASGIAAGKNGAGIKVDTGSLYLYDVDLKGGSTTVASISGGALYVSANTTAEIHGGTVTGGSITSNGGAIYNAGKLTLDGGVVVTGGTAAAGGALYQANGGQTDLKKGTITGGVSTGNGGNVYIAGGTFNMGVQGKTVTDELNESVKITDGWASGSGAQAGNVYFSAGTMNLYYGTISGGKAYSQGGNIRINSTLNMYEGVISGGRNAVTSATAVGSVASDNSNAWLVGASAVLNMSGGHIHGYTYAYKNGTAIPSVKLSGSAKIYADGGKGLILSDGVTVTVSGLTSAAKVGITSYSTAAEVALSGAITDASVLTGLFSDDATYKLALKDDNILYRVSADTVMGAVVNEGGIMLPLPKAVAAATGENDFVRMLSDHTGTITVDHSLNLDLNGKKITPDEGKSAIVLTAGTLKLADSANSAYTDEGNRVTIDNQGGTIERAFITGTFTNYGSNHRFLVLKHEDGTYSSHRIYLAVQNPVLFPASASISFRTVLLCDETVAGYTDDYGIVAVGEEKVPVSYESAVLAFGTEQNMNSKVAGIVGILKGGDDDETRATTDLSAYAYMSVDDYFDGDKEVTSSAKSANLKQVVQNADKATLTNPQKIAMATMYSNHASLMQNWELEQIPELTVDFSTIERHCLCGDTTSENNPCAAKGHIQLDWQPLPEDFGGNTLYEGNYYLTGDLELTAQMNIPADNMVCIDTKGNNITVQDGTMARGALVYGVLNLTNSTYHEDNTKVSTFTGTGTNAANGGTVLITGASGNMSLYTGVTLACTPHADSSLTQGTVTVYLGSMNIYGGVVQGVSGDQNGGAIRTNGYVFINSGSIIGGTGNANGGAISTYGDAEVMIRDSAEITGGEAENGGLIYMENGVVTLYNKTLTGTTATNGGAVYVKNGTLNLNGTVTGDSYNTVLSGGTAENGGVVYMESGTLNLNGAKIVGGTATNGGAVYMAGGNVSLTSSAMVDGGTASLGGAVYVADGAFSMNSSTVQKGHATRTSKTSTDGCGSNFYMLAGTLKITNNSVVQGGTSNYYDADGYGGSVLYAKGGTVTVEDSKLYGVLTQYWKRGGTIFNNGGAITIENTEVTASKVGNNGSVLLNAAGSFTMKGSSKLDASALTKATYGGAVVNNATFNMVDGQIIGCPVGYTNHGGGAVHTSGTFEMSGGTIRGGSTADTATSNYQNLGGNVRVSGGTFTMTGGSIEGGAATGTNSFGGGNVAITGGTFTMTGGSIEGGTSSTNGGNVLVAGGNFNLKGGTIGSDTVPTDDQATYGGNIYVNSGTVTMTGGTIQNGKVGNTGGNVYLNSGSFALEKGEITGGSAVTNSGNVFINNATFTLGKADQADPDDLNETAKITGGQTTGSSANVGNMQVQSGGTLNIYYGTISDGYAANQCGNLQNYGTVNMYGGVIQGGTAAKGSANKNIWLRAGTFNMSGGYVAGAVQAYGVKNSIKVSGSAKLHNADSTSGLTLTVANSVEPMLLVGELTEGAKVVVQTSTDHNGLIVEEPAADAGLATLAQCDRYIRDGQLVYAGSNQLTWEAATDDAVEGIYQKRANSLVWHCICGAAAGDDHIGECTGHEVQWTEWSLDKYTYLPLTPGYYYLTGTENSGDEPYLQLGLCTTYCYDYYYDSTNNSYKRLYRVALDANGNELETPIYWDPINKVEVTDVTDADLVENLGIYIDLNGQKVQGANTTRVINGLNSNSITVNGTAYKYQRYGNLNLYLCDGTNGHEGALAAYGTYSGDAYDNGASAQGAVVWMPRAGDQLNGYRVEINASNVKMGWGNALTTNANADLYQCELVGGVSQGYRRLSETASLLTEGETVETFTVGSSANGGGTLLVDVDATVTMHGGTIRDGVSVYRYMEASNGSCVDRSSGGGNVFINGGTFIVDGTESTATISGGKALLYDAADTNPLGGTYKYGAGGAVYLGSGQFIVKGNVNISDNVSGSVTGTLVADPTVVGSLGGYLDMSTAVISETGNDNVYLNGYVMQLENVTGKLGFNMVSYEGTFAKLLEGNTTAAADYWNILDRDDSGANTYESDGDELLIPTDGYTVGYGSYSITPTAEDIANGLALNGYGNTSYSTSGESTRFTRTGWGDTQTTVREELLATAMAFTDEQGDTVIVINVDATSFSTDIANGVKNRVSVATGVPRENITVSAAHQHSTPAISTTYWTNTAGKYTAKPTGTFASYADLYSGTQLEANQPRVIRTNYAATFYNGVVNAAVAAMEDRETVTVTSGLLDTTSGGTQQFNFIRNIKLMKDGVQVGMYTDNHRDLNPSEYDSMAYESDVDTTMQLVQFTRSDGTAIVLANFQTHPHLGGGVYNLDITSDVVGAFRAELSSLYEGNVQVMYLSGAGGDVNTTSKIEEDVASLQGYLTTTSGSTPDEKAARVTQYGTTLAGVAKTFLDAGMTSVDVTNADVEAMAQTYTFNVWDEKAEYEEAGKADLYASLVERSKLLVNWDTNSYRNNPYSYWESGTYKVINGVWTASTDADATTHWDYFVNNLTAGLTEKGDEIHSYHHANGVRNRYERIYVDNNPTGELEITAYNLGGIGFVAAPYEMFQMNGQQIKANDVFDMTIVATQANGAGGYIPTAEAYVNGGYSVDTTIYAPGTGEKLVTAYVEMLGAVAGN